MKGYSLLCVVTFVLYSIHFTELANGQVTSYACNISQVIICGDAAIKDATKHECNWQLIIPKYDGCVYEATRGCVAVIQLEIDGWVRQLNTTIHQMNTNTAQTTTGCVHECLNDQTKKAEVDKCSHTGTGLEALKQKIMLATGTSQKLDAECKELHSIEACMMAQVGDCVDIFKYIGTILDKVQWTELENICQTNHTWPNSNATGSTNGTSGSSGSGLDVEYVIIIVVAIVVLVAVNIVVCFVIYRERQRKEHAKLLQNSTTDGRSSDPAPPPYSGPDGPYVNPRSPYMMSGGAYTGLYPSLHTGGMGPGFYGSKPPSYGAGGYGDKPYN